ncbi:co-chaperone DjlA [Candidatus Spongiihabitans sp.]|uniref:co-chaperone DjlA n=1 Tax=Candidatus Spongiihabitans sp. TaxID=3101308 RepID=UPI003C705582
MAWWGKVVGGTFGFLIGGPIGAMLGASLGHRIDQGLSQSDQRQRYFPGDQERTQAAFFTATFLVMGHIAKADGKVSANEISLANQLMNHMQLGKAQKKAAIELFDRGKAAEFDLAGVLMQFRQECHRRSTLLRMFLEIQVQVAFADGRLDPKENIILSEIAQALGFRHSDLQMIIEMMRGGSAAQASNKGFVSDPYKTLGVTADTPYHEIKNAYRRLLSQHHPDKLVSKGLPEEMVKLANEKTHEIRMAWQRVQEIHKGDS